MSEETNVSNFDNHSEIRKLNFSVMHKQAVKPGVEKISKKFDPYQYFKNECIQSHQNNNKRTEEEIEKVFFAFCFFIFMSSKFFYFKKIFFVKKFLKILGMSNQLEKFG